MSTSSLDAARTLQVKMRHALETGQYSEADGLLKQLRVTLLEFDSLPPLSLDTPNSLEERILARDVYEDSVYLSIGLEDKEVLEKCLQCLRPFYTPSSGIPESIYTSTIRGAELLFLLIENRLDEFHSTLELLSEAQLGHPAIAFATELDQQLMVGSFDKVLSSATNPPHPAFKFILKSLINTVRITIGECISSSYESLDVSSARTLLMFDSLEETEEFVNDNFPWRREFEKFQIRDNNNKNKADMLNSSETIRMALSYATELDRIV